MIDPQDLERLSAYLDDALPEAERQALERRLAVEDALRREIASLRATRALIRALPQLKAPRDLRLTLTQARPRPAYLSPWFSGLSAAAAALLLSFGFFVLAQPGAPQAAFDAVVAQRTTQTPATEPVDRLLEVEASQATRDAAAPTAATAEADDRLFEIEEGPAASSADLQAAEAGAAAPSAPLPPEAAEAAVAQAPVATQSAERALETSAAGPASALAAGPTVSPTPAPTQVAQPTVTPAPAPGADDSAIALHPGWLLIAVGLVLLVVAASTTIMRRRG